MDYRLTALGSISNRFDYLKIFFFFKLTAVSYLPKKGARVVLTVQ